MGKNGNKKEEDKEMSDDPKQNDKPVERLPQVDANAALVGGQRN